MRPRSGGFGKRFVPHPSIFLALVREEDIHPAQREKQRAGSSPRPTDKAYLPDKQGDMRVPRGRRGAPRCLPAECFAFHPACHTRNWFGFGNTEK